MEAVHAGPSGLTIHTTVSVTITQAGNGHSSNGTSGSETPKRPKKRPRRPESWKRTVAKVKRARGQSYVSPSTGKTVPARSTGDPCHCKKRCFDLFSAVQRVAVIDSFNSLANQELQDAHLFGLITSSPIRRRRPRQQPHTAKQRQATNTYHVRVDGKREAVCQKAFAALHGVSLSRVRRIAKASPTSIVAPKDRRGKHTNRPRKITAAVKQQVKEHIKSFPGMKSHYSRSKNKRRCFLSPLLSVAEMHRLYTEKYKQEKPVVKYHYYSQIFNEEFNLSFGYPKSDTCGTCEQFRNILASVPDDGPEKRAVQQSHEEHLHSAERFYADIRMDTEVAKTSDDVCTVTFDFQQNLPLPHIPVGDLFYMHQLWVYVFGVHSCGDNNVAMYCWPETLAKRGSDEVISCLQHFLSQLPASVTSLRLFSDGCSGQNKNYNVMHFLFCLVAEGKFKHIRHTFPVRGHSYLPNDRDFGRTEVSKRKNERVYTLQQWMSIIESARRHKPFKAVPGSQSMFLSYNDHFSAMFKKTVKSTDKKNKKSLNIRKARVIEYSVDHVTEVWIKYTLSEDEEWTKFAILKRRATAHLPLPEQTKYNDHIPVKATKAADIKEIVDKYVPEEYKEFYDVVLPAEGVSSDTDDDGDSD